MADHKRPFNADFIIKVTVEHMRGCVDYSIERTLDRLPELITDPIKSGEAFQALSRLQMMKRNLNEFKSDCSNINKGE